ncbi:DUF1996 domain-containing protein [Kibdelosporangium aridum]|uniref:DUF1996 domain-containing protein n=1 Tax=Kibdelosporangium aridum TaxID=2030 RepID=UPI000A9EEEB4
MGLIAVATAGTATVAIAANTGNDQGQPASLSEFVRIENVQASVRAPQPQKGGSTGTFTVDCGTNGNRKFSPDNPVAQPGVKNGAQHVHDFVGNLSISAEFTDESLEDSDTTCKNGDKSSYFWPVVRVNKQANRQIGANADTLKAAGTPSISCPAVADRLPAVPDQARTEVDQNLRLLTNRSRKPTSAWRANRTSATRTSSTTPFSVPCVASESPPSTGWRSPSAATHRVPRTWSRWPTAI